MRVLFFYKDKSKMKFLEKALKELSFYTKGVSTEDDFVKELNTDLNEIALIDVDSIDGNRDQFTRKIVEAKKNTYLISSINSSDLYFRTDALIEGIDDYIYNDFKISELGAKIKSVIRTLTKVNTGNETELLMVEDLELNPMNRTAVRQGKEIELTNKEFLILEYLLRNKNRIITKTMLIEKIWNDDYNSTNNSVHVYINFLRRKIDKNYDYKIIRTVRGSGYMIKD